MSKEMDFFIYLIERYGARRGITGAQVLELLDSKGVTGFVFDMYELYHSERIENAFEDIDRLLVAPLAPQ
ncbi:MAG: DUF3791 domain-containing protein [Coriobacteriales bacterium]|jgi:hypothetical protein|nr:DUF3791 domain-containing protein [Coriobacteriales bacterium]